MVPRGGRLQLQFGNFVANLVTVRDFEYGTVQNPRALTDLLQLWRDAGGWDSGTWCMGTLRARPDTTVDAVAAKYPGFPDGLLLAHSEWLGCGLALDEQQQSLLVVHVEQAGDSALDNLLQMIAEESHTE